VHQSKHASGLFRIEGARLGLRIAARRDVAAASASFRFLEAVRRNARRHPFLAIVATFFFLLIGLWVGTWPVWSWEDDCQIGQVSKQQYRQMLRQAKGEIWGVWPNLSNGIFWPSDRGLYPASRSFEKGINERLQQAMEQLNFDRSSADAQLAAAHAVLRSIGADFTRVSEIADFRQQGKLVSTHVNFLYFLPQRRFAPLCLVCFLFRYSTISISFRHDLIADVYRFDHFNVLHGEFKYDADPNKSRNVHTACPAFPRRDEK
jgi:hypothetical protein